MPTPKPISSHEDVKVDLFMPHPNFGDEINRNICQSEIEGGVLLDRVPVGTVLELETKNRLYRIENCGNHEVLIAGHPKYCPEPVLVHLNGSTWGRSLLKEHFIGRGMQLEFRHPEFGIVRTSRIREVRELSPELPSPSEHPHTLAA